MNIARAALGLLGIALVAAGCGSRAPSIDECIADWNAAIPAHEPYGHNLFGIVGIRFESPHKCLFAFQDAKGAVRGFERRGRRYVSVPFDKHQKIRAKSATRVSIGGNGQLTKVGPAKPANGG